jgi:hypothetical protein
VEQSRALWPVETCAKVQPCTIPPHLANSDDCRQAQTMTLPRVVRSGISRSAGRAVAEAMAMKTVKSTIVPFEGLGE